MRFNVKEGCFLSLGKFCRSTTLHAYSYPCQNRGYWHRFLWICIHLLFTLSTVLFVSSLWAEFMKHPIVTQLENSHYPVTKVPFPAIGICNNNKISRRKAKSTVSFISKYTNLSENLLMKGIALLGNYYDFEISDQITAVNLQNLIDKINSPMLEPYNLLKSLSTNCEEFLAECVWKGESINCSKIFQLRLTFDGFCCTFNYVKSMGNETPLETEVAYTDAGKRMGLQVTIKNDPKDYLYSSISSLGSKMLLFNPNDFPDKNSGSLDEYLIGMSTQNYYEIVPTTQRSSQEIINYPLDNRRCLFQSERETEFGLYSESDCLVNCKVESMKALCNCVPFTNHIVDEDFVCNLMDIECIYRYRSKWTSLKPYGNVGNTYLEQEKHNSLECKERCFPACDNTLYKTSTNLVPLSIGNDSVIRIFFKNRYSDLYQQDVMYHWFEILSNFGGAFGLMIGFSFISAVEIIVYCTYKIVTFSINYHGIED